MLCNSSRVKSNMINILEAIQREISTQTGWYTAIDYLVTEPMIVLAAQSAFRPTRFQDHEYHVTLHGTDLFLRSRGKQWDRHFDIADPNSIQDLMKYLEEIPKYHTIDYGRNRRSGADFFYGGYSTV